MTHDSQAVRHLIETLEAERVLLGTDCPFDMAELDPIARSDALPGLSTDEHERIHSRHALELLGERDTGNG